VSVQDLELVVSVAQSPAGEAEVSVRSESGQDTAPFNWRSDDHDLLQRNRTLQARERGTSTSRSTTPSVQAIETFGDDLFDSLFPDGPVRERFDAARGLAERRGLALRIRLSIEVAELAGLAWEYLRDPKRAEFLGLAAATTIARSVAVSRRIPPLTIRPPLRILSVIASAPDHPELEVDRERQRLEDALWKPASAGLVALETLSNGTWRELQSALLDGSWHILHLVGSGGYDDRHADGFVRLPDETGRPSRLSAKGLGRMLGDHSALRLAILDVSEAAREDTIDALVDTALTLTRGGTAGVVALPGLMDRATVEFHRAFYAAIADGVPVHVAIAIARRSMAAAIEGSFEWGLPALFTSADDGVLFQIESAPASVEPITSQLTSPHPVLQPPAAAVASASPTAATHGGESADLGPTTMSSDRLTSRLSGTKVAGRSATEGASMARERRTDPRKLIADAIMRGGYVSALVGAELGAFVAMLVIPILNDQGIIENILGIWPDQDLTGFKEGALWIGLWLGIVGGAYATLALFRVADKAWTTFIVAILAVFFIGAGLLPEFSWLGYGDPSTLDNIGQRVGIAMAAIVIVARGITRFARNGTL
jgi:hypothetical protein